MDEGGKHNIHAKIIYVCVRTDMDGNRFKIMDSLHGGMVSGRLTTEWRDGEMDG